MKKQKLILGCATLAGFVAAFVGLFVPYVSFISKIGSSSNTQRYGLFDEHLTNKALESTTWITISKIALIVLLVALFVAGIAIIYSSSVKKAPKWLNAVVLIAGLVAVLATIILAGAMICYGSANRDVNDLYSIKLWGAVGFWLAFVGGACASVCAVTSYFKKK